MQGNLSFNHYFSMLCVLHHNKWTGLLQVSGSRKQQLIAQELEQRIMQDQFQQPLLVSSTGIGQPRLKLSINPDHAQKVVGVGGSGEGSVAFRTG